MEIEDRNYDEKEAATILNVSVKTLQLWRHQHRGPRYNKLGRRVNYFGPHLREEIENNTINVRAA